ncbi:MAG TPA: methionyl-tRNA formyltransferase [Dehalococcoidia bacterium]|nr:methionyl-tRNA formyltransferase [Dehalococcoidia bacterium]
MRIVLIGQAAFAEKTLEALLEMGEEVVGVYTPPDIPGRENPLKTRALQLSVPVFQPEKMRALGVYDSYVKLKPDLNVMAFVTDIVPESILNYPELGTIQYHPSLLPRHRGGSAINWAVINGETRTGLTIFWPDKGIDTGPVLLQREVDIAPDDTVGSLYFNKLFPLGIEAIKESIALIKQGKAPKIPQDESQATYEGLCTQATIDWKEPAPKIYNLIRGTNPQPGAATSYGVRRFKVFDSELRTGKVKGSPGEVIDIMESGFLVAAPGGTILVKRVQPKGSPKIAAADFINQSGLTVDDHLGE